MKARPIDAAEGYRLFRRLAGNIELDEINEHLRGLGLRAVSPRMLIHYRRLFRHGYESYIPINRLDIALAGEDAWSDELQARYPEIAQAVAAEVTWDAESWIVALESLGVTTATVLGNAPPAGTWVILRLLATGIERTGVVTRSDRASERFHIAFDPYTSIPLAPEDSPIAATIRMELPDGSDNLVALADVILSLDRYLVRSDPSRESLVRVRRFSMGSPVEILVIGGLLLNGALRLLERLARIRKEWYEGTKAKYEAAGIELENEQRRASVQLEADIKLKKALQKEVDSAEAPLLDSVRAPHMPLGEPGSPERQRLSDAIQAAVDLPPSIEIEMPPEEQELPEEMA